MSAPTINAIPERALIDRVRRRITRQPPYVQIGIGDDAAAIEPDRGSLDILTTDCLVEGVHFRREWTPAAAIGHKALAVNLSDLAAMGAMPRAALLSLVLPADLPIQDFDDLIDGFATLAEATGAALVGGNISRSPGPLVIDVTAIGAARPRRVLRRAGGRAGDELFVTGALGAAAAGLAMLAAGAGTRAARDARATSGDPADAARAACIARHERPDPRLRIGRLVARTGAASAAMDLSDGLADAARQIAEASGTGVEIDAGAVPIAPGVADWTAAAGGSALALALAGGEDYELLFAVPARRRSRFLAACRRDAGTPVTRVGSLTREPGAWLRSTGGQREPLPAGFGHF